MELSSRQPPLPSKLCQTCQDIDFSRNVWQTNHDKEAINKERHFGTIEEIGQRANACAICALIVARLETLDNPDMNPLPSDHCSIIHRQYATNRQRNNMEPIEQYISAHYVTIKIEPRSFQGFIGPEVPRDYFKPGTYIPTPEEGIDKKPWTLMSFQPCINPVPTVDSFCRESIDHLAKANESKFSGRLRQDQINPLLPLRWLQICQKYHDKQCWPSENSGIDRLRVIDVVNMAVVDAPKKCQYVVLSYCWGSDSTVVCTRANVEQLAKPRALEDLQLPRTIDDAIQVTRAANIRYLWVDAVCIIQDDAWMLENQIPLMTQIYAQGVFTIIAASAENADAGLPGVKPGTRTVQSEIVNIGNISLITTPEDPKGQSRASSGLARKRLETVKWRSRAWTFQEELFSRRRLYFESDRVFWVCPCAFYQEETVWETNITGLIDEVVTVLDQHVYTPPSVMDAEPTIALYDNLVRIYSIRNMTYASDSLNAFAGVLNALFEKRGYQVFWGLPEMGFAQLLNWGTGEVTYFEQAQHHATKKIQLQDGSEVEVPLPSWSWSAWTGSKGLNIFSITNGIVAEWNRLSTIEFYRCSIDGEVQRITHANRRHGHLQTLPTESFELVTNSLSRVMASTLDTEHDPLHRTLMTDMQKKWIGSPYEITNDSKYLPHKAFIDSGLLKFWTSTSTVYLQRRLTNLSKDSFGFTVLSPNGTKLLTTISMQTISEPLWNNNARYEKYPPAISRLHMKDGCDILSVDAIVTGNTETHLRALVVEWEGGIAYRRGLFTIEEGQWVKLEREWVLVTLG